MQLRLGAAAVVLVLLVTVPSMLRTAPPAGDPVTTGGSGSPNPTVVTTQPPVAPPVVTPPVAPPTAPTIQVTGTYAIAGRQPGQMFQVIVTGAPANPRFTIGGEEAVPARVATGPGRYELQWRATNGTLAKTTLETLQIRGGRQRVEIAMFESGRREPLAKVSEELTREAVVAPPPPPKPPAPSAPSQPAPQAAKPPAGAAAAVPVPQTPPTRVPDDDPRGNGLPPAQGNQSGPDLVRPEPPPAASPRPTESSRQADPPPPQSQNRPERSVAEIAKEVADRINGVCDDDKCKNKRPAEFNAILRAVENLQDVMKERQMYSADLENKRANVANSAVKDTQDRLRKLLGALREIAKGKYTPYQNEFSRREQQKR
jgi:hypothetical protein